MTEELNAQETVNSEQPSERDLLRARATQMGISFSPNISNETLKERILAKLNGTDSSENQEEETPVVETEMQIRARMYKEQMKLVRIKYTNVNPHKADLPGEILTFSNKFLGTVKKYIPFGEEAAEGWHVPNCIYQLMIDKEFNSIREVKDPVTKKPQIVQKIMKEYSITVLPDLTEEELEDLKKQQLAAGL